MTLLIRIENIYTVLGSIFDSDKYLKRKTVHWAVFLTKDIPSLCDEKGRFYLSLYN